MPPNYYSGGFAPEDNSFKWTMIVQIVTLVLVIAILAIVASGKSSESFIMRGQPYIGGQMIYGDVPEKVSAGGEEYDNPLYEEISRRWEPTDKKVNGYTVWKQKD
jgi:hypothetical protein